MQLSFFHIYVNILIWGAGAMVSVNFSPTFDRDRSYYNLNVFFIILPVLGLLAILTFLYQISEKTCCLKGCKCCSSCCCPFTQRSVHSTDEDQQEIKTQRHSNSQEKGFELSQIV